MCLGPVLWLWSPGSSSGVPGAALVGLWRLAAGEMGERLAGVTGIGKTLVSAFSIQLEIPLRNVSGKPGKSASQFCRNLQASRGNRL